MAAVLGCSSQHAAVIDAAGVPPAVGTDADPSDGGGSAVTFVGNITTRREVRSDFTQYWNQITPENEGKWGSVEPSEGTFNWSALDTIYKQQKAVMQEQFTMFWNNSNIKGITLWGYVYGQTWMPNTGLIQSDGTMRPAMAWLQSFLGR